MVFCRRSQQTLEDCEHCVYPLLAPRHAVLDEKVKDVAYDASARILEVTLKTGQAWQLHGVPAGLYRELCESTISSFLRFIARRYPTVPVKTGLHAIKVPTQELCGKCRTAMRPTHRTSSTIDRWVRVQWTCDTCKTVEWRTYGHQPGRERKARLH
jgi:hypothetical protein